MKKTVSSKLVLKIAPSMWKNESRDKRELSVVKELGAEVLVLAKGESTGVVEQVDGFNVYRMSTHPLGSCVPNVVNRIVSLFTWAWQVRKIAPQAISGHDLIALLIGYISTLFQLKRKRPKLIYDSHEFEIGINAKRNKLHLYVITHLEHFLIKKCDFTIVVNDNIADEIQKIHKVKRPIVVRNIPEYWEVDSEICRKIRKELYNNRKFIAMYHGAITAGRGIEVLIKLLMINKELFVVILGNGEKAYIQSLRQIAKISGVEQRILFYPAVNITELWKYIGAADIGMILAPATCKNHLYSLPNKFFENIQSETPIICPHYPVMKVLVDKYQIGLTCNPMNLKEINECIEKMRKDKKWYQSCKDNIKKVKMELCWENEKEILDKEYRRILI